MGDIDRELRELQLKVIREEQQRIRRDSLYEQKRELEEQERDLSSRRVEEQRDVDQMEHNSLKSFFYHLSGKYDEKLDKEQREAYAAAVKHDAVTRELEAVQYEIRQAEAECAKLNGCKQRYKQLLEEKKAAVMESDPVNGAAILELEEKIQYRESQKREIEEALSAGRRALSTADSLLSSLGSAESWGTWDILGGGLLTDMAKYSHIDDAQRKVEQLQLELRRFKTELADVTIYQELSVKVDGTLRFADYFFDGLFVDWAVLNRIHNSQKQVADTKRQIEGVICGLRELLEETKEQQEKLMEQMESLIVAA